MNSFSIILATIISSRKTLSCIGPYVKFRAKEEQGWII